MLTLFFAREVFILHLGKREEQTERLYGPWTSSGSHAHSCILFNSKVTYTADSSSSKWAQSQLSNREVFPHKRHPELKETKTKQRIRVSYTTFGRIITILWVQYLIIDTFQLVLAAFPPAGGSASPHLNLLLKSFQSIFPSLSPQTISLSSARRVVLVHYNEDRDSIDFRHYLITIRPQGVSRRVRKLLEGTTRGSSILDLGNEKDVADYILRQAGQDGYETASSYASDAGEDGADNKIELPSDYVGRNNKKGEQRVVSLEEIGPRMELKLLKITEGMPGKEGAVIWHRFGTYIHLNFFQGRKVSSLMSA
jgi:hypothetical protein